MYCTRDQVIEELAKNNEASSVDNAAIDARITRVTGLIDKHCGHSFERKDVGDELAKAERVQLDENGDLVVSVLGAKCDAVLGVPAWSQDMKTWTPITATPFIDGHVLTFVDPGIALGRNDRIFVKLSYRSGYDPIPADIEAAACRWTAYLYMKRGAPFDVTGFPAIGQVTIPSGVPSDIVDALSDYVRRRP